MKDVRNILDIPYIDKYLNYEFDFLAYYKTHDLTIYAFPLEEPQGDSDTIILSYKGGKEIIIDIEILSDLLTQDDITFLSLVYVGEDNEEGYQYRPMVQCSEKKFID
jgi:hypothetical protein